MNTILSSHAHKSVASRILAAACLSLLFAGCSDQIGNTPTPAVQPPTLTLTGSLKFNQPITLPLDVKVVGMWSVGTWDPGGYSYVYGTGTIDQSANTFSISFPGAPPADAVNMNTLGVAIVLLVQNPPQGKVTEDAFRQLKVFGGINHTCVVYKLGNGWNPNDPPGLGIIPQGYSPAIAIPPIDMHGHDTLRVIGNSGLELLIDTSLSAFHFANWS